jgi:hypothetical protein
MKESYHESFETCFEVICWVVPSCLYIRSCRPVYISHFASFTTLPIAAVQGD